MFALEADGELKLLGSDSFLTWHAHLARDFLRWHAHLARDFLTWHAHLARDFHGRDARATFQNELLIAEHS